MSEKEVAFVDLTADESREEIEVVEKKIESPEDPIGLSEVQSALEQVDLENTGEKEADGEEKETRDIDTEARDMSREEIDLGAEVTDEIDRTETETEDTKTDSKTQDTQEKNDKADTEKIEKTESQDTQIPQSIALETKEVLDMTEDGVDEEELKEAVQKEEEDIEEMEKEEVEKEEVINEPVIEDEPVIEESEVEADSKEVPEVEVEKEAESQDEPESVDNDSEPASASANAAASATLEVPETPKSESSFGEFASEDEFGDFDDFEELEDTSPTSQIPLASSREETPMASQTNLGTPPVSTPVKSVLTDDSFTSFTSLSFAAKSVLEDNGLTQVFTEAKEPAGQKFELSESASQIYALLCSVPNSELNFLKSFTRRLLLKDVGVPLDLDELLPRKEKQHFVIRRSRRSLDKSAKGRASTDGKTPTEGSRASTPTLTDSSRAQTPVTVDTELKLDSWLRLVEIRPEQRERMEPEELQELVTQLKTANSEAKLLLKQWQDKLALGYKNKEAFEAVVENMVGFAQKQRLKKGKK
ncbi:hypothetical protein CJU90_0928 [Yarrowia sp. C11]|nr:hypothetical protein CKK34_2341 [Yarrowia sp. E02]KAG5373242.1 hypothetical protein CJU90_0928 [Yarrowia sp. C11]